jgi:hypothetical protein
VPPSGRQVRRAYVASNPDARRLAAIRTLAVDDQTARVMAALDARGVPALVLKGPSVSRRLYAENEPRFYGDTDVLVAAGSIAAAEGTLRELGYERLVTAGTVALIGHHGSHWRHRGSVLEVDLHHTLTGVHAPADELWQALSAHTVWLEVRGTPVRVLDAPALALHVALHAAQHGSTRDTPRRDLEHAVHRLSLADWQAAASLAERVGAVDALGVGLRLLPEGVAKAAELGLPPNRSRDAALRAMAAPSVTLGIDRVCATPGIRAKAGLLLAWTLPPRDFMLICSALARRGRAGLLLAYFLRILVLAGQAIPAAVAWRQAARGTHRAMSS